jgi:tRNA pseudouridine55 synthase
MDGILNINKPAGMTSHDVVDQLRRILHEKKAGHTGTLDPDATGVLPICLGKATKIIQFLQDDEKGYEGTITLGIVTDTLDASGKILRISDSDNVKMDDVRNVFSRFVGEMDQIPPMVSALKVRGKRLYSIARQGKTVNRKPRRIYIYDLELLDLYKAPCIIFDDRLSVKESGIQDVDPSQLFTKLDFRVR